MTEKYTNFRSKPANKTDYFPILLVFVGFWDPQKGSFSDILTSVWTDYGDILSQNVRKCAILDTFREKSYKTSKTASFDISVAFLHGLHGMDLDTNGIFRDYYVSSDRVNDTFVKSVRKVVKLDTFRWVKDRGFDVKTSKISTF